MAVVDIINSISKTMDELLDFVVNDKYLSNDFENYLTQNKIIIERQSDINDVLISYILDEKTSDNERVIDYYVKKEKKENTEILDTLKNSFLSVFKINKILKNAYLCTSIINETDFTLIPLVKMTNLRTVGLYDYIKARIIKVKDEFYLLEIFDCFGQFREFEAYKEAVKYIIKNPTSVFYLNDKKRNEIKNTITDFNKSFYECFKKNEIITINKNADNLLFQFSEYNKTKKFPDMNLIKNPDKYRYFDLKNDDNNFIERASYGFSNSTEIFDVGFYADEEAGLFVVPFLGSFNKILEDNSLETVENAIRCIEYIIKSDKVTKNLLLQKNKEYPCCLNLLSNALDKNFSSMNELINFYKGPSDKENISSIIALYNSGVFEKLIGFEEESKDTYSAGRNELCPCGSGKKYKRCCGQK